MRIFKVRVAAHVSTIFLPFLPFFFLHTSPATCLQSRWLPIRMQPLLQQPWQTFNLTRTDWEPGCSRTRMTALFFCLRTASLPQPLPTGTIWRDYSVRWANMLLHFAHLVLYSDLKCWLGSVGCRAQRMFWYFTFYAFKNQRVLGRLDATAGLTVGKKRISRHACEPSHRQKNS